MRKKFLHGQDCGKDKQHNKNKQPYRLSLCIYKQLKMTKFNPSMDLVQFIEANISLFEREFLDSYPEYTAVVNEGDYNPIYEHYRDDDNKGKIIGLMVEEYRLWLEENY